MKSESGRIPIKVIIAILIFAAVVYFLVTQGLITGDTVNKILGK